MNKHTKEPWHRGKNHNAERFIYGEDGWAIAECIQTKDKMFANARRIVACVNACAGVPIEILEQKQSGGLTWSFASALDLTMQRDELLEALKKIADETYDQWSNGAKAKEIALAAIEKVEANHE